MIINLKRKYQPPVQIDIEEVRSMFKSGDLSGDELASLTGTDDWKPLHSLLTKDFNTHPPLTTDDGLSTHSGRNSISSSDSRIKKTNHKAIVPSQEIAIPSKKSIKPHRISIAIAIIVAVIAVVMLPGFINKWYRIGTGHAFAEIMDRENVQWNSLSESERTPYRDRAMIEGQKCVAFMVAGQHLPLYLSILIVIGILTPSFSTKFKMPLILGLFTVWLVGMSCLAFGARYWGQSLHFPVSLGSAFLIYLMAGVVFGIIVGIGKLIQRYVFQPKSMPSNEN